MFELKSLLAQALKRNQIEGQVTVAQIIVALNETIRVALPPGRSDDARAISVRDRIASVACLNAPAAQLIAQKTKTILDAVTQRCPRADLRGIRTRIVHSFSNVVE